MAKKGVYDMLATAMFRIFLIMSIGALAVGKFGGFVV